MVFFFFLQKNLCRAPMAKAVGKDGFFLKKKFFAESPVQLRSAKLGHPSWEDFS
jgi:protein-tyrosine-phosphatase